MPARTSILAVALFKKTTLESYLYLFLHMSILHFTAVASSVLLHPLLLSASDVTSSLLMLSRVLAAFDASSTLLSASLASLSHSL